MNALLPRQLQKKAMYDEFKLRKFMGCYGSPKCGNLGRTAVMAAGCVQANASAGNKSPDNQQDHAWSMYGLLVPRQ